MYDHEYTNFIETIDKICAFAQTKFAHSRIFKLWKLNDTKAIKSSQGQRQGDL